MTLHTFSKTPRKLNINDTDKYKQITQNEIENYISSIIEKLNGKFANKDSLKHITTLRTQIHTNEVTKMNAGIIPKTTNIHHKNNLRWYINEC